MSGAVNKLLALSLVLCLILGMMAGCTPDGATDASTDPQIEVVDYAAAVKLNMSSSTLKQEVTVKNFVDGDTVHFNVPESVMPGGVLKARFLAINTPESTGKIEEYGKAASKFTKETLSKASSIVLESDSNQWDADSTGGRYLVWVWYKTADMADYRNLNLEILQNGLAIASNSGGNSYGSYALSAISQAKAQKLNIHSGKPDPDFYYGEAVELDLKELRTNVESYNNVKVAFNGVVTMNSNQSVYVEAFDSETGMYYGMSVYYGYGLNGDGVQILNVGNEVRIVGTVQYYETGGTWQVSGLTYRAMKPNDPNNIQKLSEGHIPAYVETDPAQFANGTVDVVIDETVTTEAYAKLAMSTSLQMKNLYVEDVYTTQNEESSSKGAMTLTCEADGVTVSVRTVVLIDDNGNLITADAYRGKTIDVRGIVDYFDGTYQIKVFTEKDITVHG
ncbi:MAG: thermonuclease family protein [Oscillospiraceae bacterium]|nr:thermonuclease family protein [Oscillospiraceae bacterium]